METEKQRINRILKTFEFKKSTRKNKKYDAYYNGVFKISFGDNRYQQYKDRIGLYSHLDHLDKERRRKYRIRHQHNKGLAGELSKYLLW